MNRSGKFKVINITGDPKYNCHLVHKFINVVMVHGRKQKAATIVYNAFDKLEKKYMNEKKDETKEYKGSDLLLEAINKVKPQVFLRQKKIASKVYQVPVAIKQDNAIKKSIMWIVQGSRSRTTERSMSDKIFSEICQIIDEGVGKAMERRAKHNAIATANEAYVHYI